MKEQTAFDIGFEMMFHTKIPKKRRLIKAITECPRAFRSGVATGSIAKEQEDAAEQLAPSDFINDRA